MPVTFVGAGTASTGTGSTTPGIPAGVAEGDLLVLSDVAWDSAAGTPPTPGTPAGWTQKSSTTAGDLRITWMYRRWTSGVSAPTVTFTAGTDEHQSRIVAFRGAIPTGDPTDVLGSISSTSASTGTCGPISGVTTSTVAGGAVLVVGARDNDFTDGAAWSTLTGDSLTWAEITDYGGVAGHNWAMALDYALIPSGPQTVTNKTFAITGNSNSNTGAGQMWAIAAGGVEVTSSDSATATDASQVTRSSGVTDTATLTDPTALAASAAVTDSAALTDAASLQQHRAITDSASMSEALERTAIDFKSISDTATLTDAVAVDIPELLASSDTALTTDVIGPLSVTATGADAAAVGEAFALGRVSATTDSAAVTDASVLLRTSAAADTGAATELLVLTALAGVTDSAAVVEAVQILRFSAVVEVATATDSVASGPLSADSAVLSETVEVIVIPAAAALAGGGGSSAVNYELLCMARIPKVSGPPALLVVDGITWSTLRYADVLGRPQELSATVRVASISDVVAQRLLGPERQATELRLLRDGQIVAAGGLAGWHRRGADVELVASGLLGYLRRMIVLDDLRFDQVDQHLIAKALVDQFQASAYGNAHYGIDTSQVSPSGVLRDRSYVRDEQHKISQRIEELGAVDGGFDAEVDPTTRQLQLWHPFKGVDRSTGPSAIVFDHRVIASQDVSCSVEPDDLASLAFGTSSASGSDTSLASFAVNTELAASFGLSAVMGSWRDISEQATLDGHVRALLAARGQALIVPGPQMRVTPDADLGAYDVGDTVQLELGTDQLGMAGPYRIRKRVVSVAATGVETVDLELV